MLGCPAHDGGRGRGHRLERRHRALGPEFLGKAERGVQQDDRDDDDRVGEIADQAGHDGRADQDQDHQVRQLRPEHREGRAGRGFDVHIRTVARAAVRDFLGAQSVTPSREEGVGVLGRVLMPGDVRVVRGCLSGLRHTGGQHNCTAGVVNTHVVYGALPSVRRPWLE